MTDGQMHPPAGTAAHYTAGMVFLLVVVLAAVALSVLPFYLGLPMGLLTGAILFTWHWRTRLKEADHLRETNSVFQSGRAPLSNELLRR